MKTQPWWRVAVPHKDIREGQFDETVFAANLSDVVHGNAPPDYQSPSVFFKKTYVTKGIANLLSNVNGRLSGGKGDAIIQVQTAFGGGKTHSLLALYHFFNNAGKVGKSAALSEIIKSSSIKKTAINVKIAVFVGTSADPKGKTLWGEIADQLGSYSFLREYDRDKVSPGKDKILELLNKDGPVLILIDELMEYATKAAAVKIGNSTLLAQTLAFVQELTEAVAVSKDCVLVFSLPSSVLEQFDQEAAEALLTTLQKISGRIERIYTPVEGEEVYEVIRKRLFDEYGDPAIRKELAEELSRTYRELGEELPPEAKEARYREKIVAAYPFHPELVDLLFDRWGSLPQFQRTRGVLRLLAEVVSDLYKKEDLSSLVLPSNVDLSNSAIRRELVKQIGNEYESVINADICGTASNSSRINNEMGSEYSKYKIATGLSTAIFLYSFGKRGVSAQRIRLAFLRDGMPHSISKVVTEALTKMVEELWYLHTDEARTSYYFVSQPNLNRIIVDKSESIADANIEEYTRQILDKISGSDLEVYMWPKTSGDIPDTKRVKLVLLDPSHAYASKSSTQFLTELYENYASSYRTYRNNVLFLLIDKIEYEGAGKAIRRLLALRAIKEDRFITQTLSEENRRMLDGKLKESDQEVSVRLAACYKHLVKGIASTQLDLGLPPIGERLNISRRVRDRLKEEEMLLDRVAPKLILEKVFAKEDDRKKIKDIWESFFRFTQLPLLENENVLRNAVLQGVKNGTFGLLQDDKLFFEEDAPYTSYTEDSFIVRQSVVQAMRPEGLERGSSPLIPSGTGSMGPLVSARSSKSDVPPVKRINLTFDAPWNKLSEIMRGVVMPLIDEGAEVSIEMKLEAKSESGISKNTIDNKVKETLKQIGAKINTEKEEERAGGA